MYSKKYGKLRKRLRAYRLIKKELIARTEHMEGFRKILLDPLPNTEERLRTIYSEIISSMQEEAANLLKTLNGIDKALERLEGRERSVIYFRYIEGIDWINMPEYMNYEQRTCQNIETAALDKIMKMNIDWGEKDD